MARSSEDMGYLRQPALGRVAAIGDIYDADEAKFLSNSEHYPLMFSPQAYVCIFRNFMHAKYDTENTIREKFNVFEIPPELQLHILSHSLEITGSGRYMYAEKCSARAIRASLWCITTTQTVSVNISHPECWKSVEMKSAEVAQNKYVVTEITYGGIIVVTVEDGNEDGRDASTVVQELKALLESLTECLIQGKAVPQASFASARHLSWTVHSDFAEKSVLCSNLKEVIYHLEDMKYSLMFCNGGLGLPVCYGMLSLLNCFNLAYSGSLRCSRISTIDTDITNFFTKEFDDIIMMGQLLNDLNDELRRYPFCVTKEDLDLANGLLKQCQTTYRKMSEVLANSLRVIRHGHSSNMVLAKLKQEFIAKQYHLANFDCEISNLHRVHEKCRLLDYLIKKGVRYCNSNRLLDKQIMDNHSVDIYVFHYSTSSELMHNKWSTHLKAFVEMLGNADLRIKGVLFLIADHDFNEVHMVGTRPRISLINDRKMLSEDILADGTGDTIRPTICRTLASCNIADKGDMESSCHASNTNYGAPNLSKVLHQPALDQLAIENLKQFSREKQSIDGIKSLVDEIPKITKVHNKESIAQEVGRQIVKADKQCEADKLEVVQEGLQAKDKRKNVEHDRTQEFALQQRNVSRQPYNTNKRVNGSGTNQKKVEGMQLPKLLPRDINSRQSFNPYSSKSTSESGLIQHQGAEKHPPKSTNSTSFKSQPEIDAGKTPQIVHEIVHKTGQCESSEREVDVQFSNAIKTSPEVDTVFTKNSRSDAKGALINSNVATNRPESHVRQGQQTHMLKMNSRENNPWKVVQGKQRWVVGRGRSEKSTPQQRHTEMSSPNEGQVHVKRSQRRKSEDCLVQQEKGGVQFEKEIPGSSKCLKVPPKDTRDTNGPSRKGHVVVDGCHPNEQFEDSKMEVQGDPSNTINILILGESGVGKSTWINGVANYFAYDTVEEAVGDKPVYVINSSFLLTDDDYNEVLVSMGPDGDAKTKLGTSATQFAKSHHFSSGGRRVCLIDTPGIGDTKGVDKDQENFKNIFRHLSRFREIHGICILLKPNSARMNIAFQFCIKELLAHLHKDASRNIVFVFTNSRGTFYRPGDTFPTLLSLLEENKEVNIPLENERVYCMDNEPVRFLAATHQGIKFTERDKAVYSKSWEVSKAETNRLIFHITNLEPHAVELTLRLNEVMDSSLAVAKPIVEISIGIQKRVLQAENHREELLKTMSDRDKQVGTNITAGSRSKPLGRMIVCCNSTCASLKFGTDISKKYSNICHKPCKHNIRPREIFPNEDIKECEVMDIDSGKCSECGCDWKMHLCKSYELGIDRAPESYSRKYSSAFKDADGNGQVSDVTRFIAKMQSEHKGILKIGAKLGVFLKQNTISPCNDAVAELLEKSIEQEQELISIGGSSQPFSSLTKVLSVYKTETKNLEDEMRRNQTEISFGEFQQDFEDLYCLPINGKVLRSSVGDVWNAHARTFRNCENVKSS